MEVIDLKLTQIKNATENYRLDSQEKDVADLMQSIKKTGLLNPVTVQKVGRGYKLIAGFRRYNAFKKLKKKTIPANVVESDASPDAINLVENLQRENTSSYEIGRGIHRVMQKDNLSAKEVAVLLGMNRQSVETYLQLYKKTPAKFRDKVVARKDGSSKAKREGFISNTTASAIINMAKRNVINSKQKMELFEMAAKDNNINCTKIRAMAAGGFKENASVKKAASTMKQITVVINVKSKDLKKLGKRPQYAIKRLIEDEYGITLA